MPKTTKKFDWEIYDENGEFIDILSMSRTECKKYKEQFPNYSVQEIGYSDDARDDSWETSSQKGGNIYSIRIQKR